jgi:hypothetical protein
MEILLLEIHYKFKRNFYFQAFFIYYVHEFVETPKERRRRANNFGKQKIKKNQKNPKSPKSKWKFLVDFCPIFGHLSFQKIKIQ